MMLKLLLIVSHSDLDFLAKLIYLDSNLAQYNSVPGDTPIQYKYNIIQPANADS